MNIISLLAPFSTPPMTGYSASKSADQEDVYPDPTSEQMSGMWARDPIAFELAFKGE